MLTSLYGFNILSNDLLYIIYTQNNLFDSLIGGNNSYILLTGGRLNNFKILIGNEFKSGTTQAADIASWSECTSVSGKQLFHLFVSEVNTSSIQEKIT